MRLRRQQKTADGDRLPIHIEPNSSYFPETIGMFFLLAFIAYIPVRIFDWPTWIAWAVAGLHLVDELRRSRNSHQQLAEKWNVLLEDWREHEHRLDQQRIAKLRRQHEAGEA